MSESADEHVTLSVHQDSLGAGVRPQGDRSKEPSAATIEHSHVALAIFGNVDLLTIGTECDVQRGEESPQPKCSHNLPIVYPMDGHALVTVIEDVNITLVAGKPYGVLELSKASSARSEVRPRSKFPSTVERVDDDSVVAAVAYEQVTAAVETQIPWTIEPIDGGALTAEFADKASACAVHHDTMVRRVRYVDLSR